jgi:hypothetical protein
MGAEVKSKTFSREQRTRYRQRLLENLEMLASYLAAGQFAATGTIGLELELNLANADFSPALRNAAVLEAISDPAFQTEIGTFNIELNHPALSIRGQGLKQLEDSLRSQLNRADERAAAANADILMIGILPTLKRLIVVYMFWL